MSVTQEQKKDFALAQLAPYYADPLTTAYNGTGCSYLTKDGKMCVVGKNMLESVLEAKKDSGVYFKSLIEEFDNDQSKLFKPEVVGILTNEEWHKMQPIHDAIALKDAKSTIEKQVNELGLFTMEEFEEAAANTFK